MGVCPVRYHAGERLRITLDSPAAWPVSKDFFGVTVAKWLPFRLYRACASTRKASARPATVWQAASCFISSALVLQTAALLLEAWNAGGNFYTLGHREQEQLAPEIQQA